MDSPKESASWELSNKTLASPPCGNPSERCGFNCFPILPLLLFLLLLLLHIINWSLCYTSDNNEYRDNSDY